MGSVDLFGISSPDGNSSELVGVFENMSRRTLGGWEDKLNWELETDGRAEAEDQGSSELTDQALSILLANDTVMRLFPAAVFNARVANKESILPSGVGKDSHSPVFICKGDIVVFSTWAQHRLSEEFGDDLDNFTRSDGRN
ncbi:Cytochrome P450 [Penicillium capsulatum]|uniref:Cytochrome P450 n=1 Tax=Penicillium capsulatum TaxID=69766 RepID=A0A9W9LEK8_9EURO|nr:Cytochrome P450 [Penicillium capsulatum]KAJ6112537.1 Cytochrome P450 [Penicillium capsulatum]